MRFPRCQVALQRKICLLRRRFIRTMYSAFIAFCRPLGRARINRRWRGAEHIPGVHEIYAYFWTQRPATLHSAPQHLSCSVPLDLHPSASETAPVWFGLGSLLLHRTETSYFLYFGFSFVKVKSSQGFICGFDGFTVLWSKRNKIDAKRNKAEAGGRIKASRSNDEHLPRTTALGRAVAAAISHNDAKQPAKEVRPQAPRCTHGSFEGSDVEANGELRKVSVGVVSVRFTADREVQCAAGGEEQRQ